MVNPLGVNIFQFQIIDEKSLIKKYQKEISSLKEELDQLKRGMLAGVSHEEVIVLRQQVYLNLSQNSWEVECLAKSVLLCLALESCFFQNWIRNWLISAIYFFVQLEQGQFKMQSRLEEEEEAKAALMSRIQRLTKLILVSSNSKNAIPGYMGDTPSHQRNQSAAENDVSCLF